MPPKASGSGGSKGGRPTTRGARAQRGDDAALNTGNKPTIRGDDAALNPGNKPTIRGGGAKRGDDAAPNLGKPTGGGRVKQVNAALHPKRKPASSSPPGARVKKMARFIDPPHAQVESSGQGKAKSTAATLGLSSPGDEAKSAASTTLSPSSSDACDKLLTSEEFVYPPMSPDYDPPSPLSRSSSPEAIVPRLSPTLAASLKRVKGPLSYSRSPFYNPLNESRSPSPAPDTERGITPCYAPTSPSYNPANHSARSPSPLPIKDKYAEYLKPIEDVLAKVGAKKGWVGKADHFRQVVAVALEAAESMASGLGSRAMQISHITRERRLIPHMVVKGGNTSDELLCDLASEMEGFRYNGCTNKAFMVGKKGLLVATILDYEVEKIDDDTRLGLSALGDRIKVYSYTLARARCHH